MRGICLLSLHQRWQTCSAKGQIVKDFCSVGHRALLQLFSSAVVVWKQLLRDNTKGCGCYSKSLFSQQGVGLVWSAGCQWLPWGLQRSVSSRRFSSTPAYLLSPFIQILQSRGFLAAYQPFPL